MDLADAGKAVGAVVALVGGLYSGGAWVDTRYAHVSDVRQWSIATSSPTCGWKRKF